MCFTDVVTIVSAGFSGISYITGIQSIRSHLSCSRYIAIYSRVFTAVSHSMGNTPLRKCVLSMVTPTLDMAIHKLGERCPGKSKQAYQSVDHSFMTFPPPVSLKTSTVKQTGPQQVQCRLRSVPC